GAGKPTRARELYWQGVWMSAVLAVVVTIPIVITSLLLEAGGIDHAVAVETRKYLFCRSFSIFPMFVFFTARSYLQSVKRTRELVEAVVVANVANFFL